MRVIPLTYRGQLRRTIRKVKAQIKELETLALCDNIMGEKWREGELAYFRRLLAEKVLYYQHSERVRKPSKRTPLKDS